MKKEAWYEDQPVLKSDLDRAQNSKEEAIRERLLDLNYVGVIKDSQLQGEASEFVIQQGPAAGLFITVNTGVAVSPAGERILLPAISLYNPLASTATIDNGIGGTTLVPQSSGSQNIPLTNNAVNSVWIGYLQTTDTTVFTLSEVTNERLFVKKDDGYQITVTTTSTNPDASKYVLLGEVTTLAGSVVLINLDNTKEAAVTGPTIIPGTPYQVALTVLPNILTELDRPVSIPTVTGFTYTAGTPAAAQFTVNFSTGVVTFNAANTGASVTINYLVTHTRRQYALAKSNSVGGAVSLNDRPASYEAGSVVTLSEHINARGVGVISPTNPHGTTAADIGLSGIQDLGGRLASSGITIEATGDASSPASSLSPSATTAFIPGDNKVVIAPLVAGESVNIAGTIVTTADIPTQVTYDFLDPVLPLPPSTFYFYIDKSTKTLARTTGSIPSDGFPVASIYWDGSKLILPIADLRFFGTSARSNIRLETLLGLATGSATDNRTHNLYNARLIGTAVVTSPSYAFVGLGGTTLTVVIDGTPGSVTFPASPVDTTISSAIAAITSQIPGVVAVKTMDNRIKLLAAYSITITGGSAAPILGFVAAQTDNETVSFLVSASNNKINFKINGGITEYTATLTNGTYTMGNNDSEPGTLCELVKQRLQIADTLGGIYTVTFNIATNKLTISRSSGTFQLLWLSGTNGTAGTNTSAYSLLGFTAADTAVAASITSNSTTASPVFSPSNQNIKEVRISGSTSSIGVGGESLDAEIDFIYDSPNQNVVRVESHMGNKLLTTTLAYNADGSLRSAQETVV